MANELAVRDVPLPETIEERKAQTDLTIQTATYWATSLMQVVEKCGLAKQMGGKKYLEVEGWQLIAEFAHVRTSIEWVRPWRDQDGVLIGYEARCRLIDDQGNEIGGGESSCGLDAFPCRSKVGSEKDKAAKSAAQTWAISRALRNKFSFVAKIAGYQPTPAEEMHEDAPQSTIPRPSIPQAQPAAKAPVGPKADLRMAILDFVNNDKKAAGELLWKIAKTRSINDMTDQQASMALERFKKDVLNDIPMFTQEQEEASALEGFPAKHAGY